MDTSRLKVFSTAMQHKGVTPDSPLIKSMARRFGIDPGDLRGLCPPEEEKPKHFVCWKCEGKHFENKHGSLVICDCDNGIIRNV
jgi:hypothetical protein